MKLRLALLVDASEKQSVHRSLVDGRCEAGMQLLPRAI
jgi:hypothetical protein